MYIGVETAMTSPYLQTKNMRIVYIAMGRKPRKSDGWRTCTRCLQKLEETAENFYYNKRFSQWGAKCKPCQNEVAKESAEKNKYDTRRRALLREAREKGDTLKKCQKCKIPGPSRSFVPYDTNVYLDDVLILKGYKEICGVCYFKLKDAVFSKINGCMKYAEERRTKTNKFKVS